MPVSILACGLLLTHAVLASLARQPAVGTGHDDALYLILARSLAHGSYQELHYSPPGWHSQYPPGVPGLLMLSNLILGDTNTSHVVVGIVSSVIALGLTYVAVLRLMGPVMALLILAACSLNPGLIQYAGEISSEAPFMAAVAVSLWAVLGPLSVEGRPRLAACAAIAASLIRSAGLPLMAALEALFLLQRRFRRAVLFAIASSLTFGAWLAWSVLAPHKAAGRSYVADIALSDPGTLGLRGYVAEMHSRLIHYISTALPFSLALPWIPGTAIDNVVYLVIPVVLGVVGLVAAWRSWPALSLFLIGYGGLLAVWPWVQSRFVIPLIPFAWLVIALGAHALARRFRPWVGWGPLLLLWACALLGSVRATSNLIDYRTDCNYQDPTHSAGCFSPDQLSFFAAADYAREHTAPDAVFLVSKDATWYYYSGRRVTRSIPVQDVDPAHLADYLRDEGVEYIVLANLKSNEREQLSWMYRRICDQLELVKSFPPRTYLFRLKGENGDGDACAALVNYRSSFTPADISPPPPR